MIERLALEAAARLLGVFPHLCIVAWQIQKKAHVFYIIVHVFSASRQRSSSMSVVCYFGAKVGAFTGSALVMKVMSLHKLNTYIYIILYN